jgi:glutamine cyclotransferase
MTFFGGTGAVDGARKACRALAVAAIVFARSAAAGTPAVTPLKILRTIPHTGYSEGLDYADGYLWNAVPKEIRKIDPADGTVLSRYTPPTAHSEGIAWWRGELWNLSFSDNGIYRAKPRGGKMEFKKVGKTPELHGWGLTHDGKHLLMTGNFSKKIYFVDPKTFKVARTIEASVTALEDLAWDGRWIWTSSFTERRGQIFRVDPKTGKIAAFYSLPDPESCPVIDGIAYDGRGLWITGKECPALFYAEKPK